MAARRRLEIRIRHPASHPDARASLRYSLDLLREMGCEVVEGNAVIVIEGPVDLLDALAARLGELGITDEDPSNGR